MSEAALGAIARVQKDENRKRELKRCQTDSYYLATQYLDYGWNPKASGGKDSPFPGKGLTEQLHKPICRWYDARRQRLAVGVWIPRWHHKSTLMVVWMIQDFLIDPVGALLYWQSTNDLAAEVVQEVGNHLQRNDKLRKLEPIGMRPDGSAFNVLPSKLKKKFLLADEFTLNRPLDLWQRFPSLVGKGSGTEMTGKHGRKGYLDDIIGRNTIIDSQLPVVESWFQSTVIPVIDDAMFRVTGTRWHQEAVYEKWIADPDWCCIVLPCSVPEEFDLVMNPKAIDWSKDKILVPKDPTLERPIYGPPEYRDTQKKKLKFLQRQMGPDFEPQMQNDPTPPGELPWSNECEHYCSLEDAKGAGLVVTLSDPAPRAVGGADRSERLRRDGTKNDWSVCTVKLRRMGELRQIILLDGEASKEWDLDEGMDRVTGQALRWHAKEAYAEHTSSPIFLQALYDAKSRGARSGSGWRGHVIQKLENTYIANAKNEYFSALASRAKHAELLICSSCPKPFLDKFLAQARRWRPQANGTTGIPLDDCANVVAFATDPYFAHRYAEVSEEWSFSPFRRKEEDGPTHGNRYVGW